MINDSTEVPLYRNGEVAAHALIDGDDAERVLPRLWLIHSDGYAVSTLRGREGATILMHRLVMGLEQGDGLIVDHIDRNPLNNRKSNLRVVTAAQNHQNRASSRLNGGSSQHRNVSRAGDRWRARLTLAGQQISLGCFDDEETAAQVASIGRAILMPYSEDAATPRGRIWRAVNAEIPNEREVIQWPVEGDDAARAIRLTQLCGDVMYAVLSGRTDIVDDLARVIASATLWAESLVRE